MSYLQSMVLEGDRLYSDYTFYNPYLIPSEKIKYWLKQQLNNTSPEDALTDFVESEELYPYQVQNALMAITHGYNQTQPETRHNFLTKLFLIFGANTTLGNGKNEFKLMDVLLVLIDALFDDDILSFVLVLAMINIANNDAVFSAHKAKTESDEKYDVAYQNAVSHLYAERAKQEDKIKESKRKLKYPKLTPFPNHRWLA